MKNQHTSKDRGHGRNRSRLLNAPARLGQGVEQIEPRIMLAGESLTDVPAVIVPVAERASAIVDGGYVKFSDSTSYYNSPNSFSFDGISYDHVILMGSAGADVLLQTNLSSVPRASVSLDALQIDHGGARLEFAPIKSASEGGFAYMTLVVPTAITTGAVSPGVRDAIAVGVTAPVVRSTLSSDAPLEAARGRSQAFELSANVQDVLRSAPVVNAHAVDAAMAQFGKMQPALTALATATRKAPPEGEVSEADSPATIDRLLVAARKVEAQLKAPQTGGVAATSALSVPARSTDAAQTSHRDGEQSAELPAEALLAAQSNPETDGQSSRKSLLSPLLELDSSVLTDAPGLWAFAVVVSLAGLYWQKTALASPRWPAREHEGPQLRRLHVRVAQ